MSSVHPRMTAVIHVHQNTTISEPIGRHYNAQVNLTDEKEEPYTRRLVIGPDPVKMDQGWLAQNGYHSLLVANITSLRLQVQPSQEDLEQMAKQVLFVAFDELTCGLGVQGMRIPPGLFNFLSPEPGTEIWMKCLDTECRVEILLIPR